MINPIWVLDLYGGPESANHNDKYVNTATNWNRKQENTTNAKTQ